MFDHYERYEYALACVQRVLFMLGMGLQLRVHEFSAVARAPRSFVAALLGHLFAIPLLALAINHLFVFEGGMAIGLLMVSAMPGGGISKVFTFLGRGNVPLSISLSLVSSVAALVTVPLMLRFFAAEYVSAGFSPPIGWVLRDVGLFLLLPLAIGMAIGPRLGSQRRIVARICLWLGMSLVAVMVYGSLASQRIKPGVYGWKAPIAIILFCLLGQQLNQIVFYVKGWARRDRLAAGIEVTMRNMNLALMLKALIFPNDDALGQEVLFVILFYAGAAMVAGLALALNHRRLASRHAAIEGLVLKV